MTVSKAFRWPLLLAFSSLSFVSLTFAQSGEATEEEEPIRKGVIASTGSYGFADTSIDSGSTAAAPGDKASVINGSVSKLSRDECRITLMNASEGNSYSVSYRVIGRNKSGAQVFKKSYAARIASGEKYTKDIRCRHELNYEISLADAKKR